MTANKTKYEQFIAFFTLFNDIHFPAWMFGIYNMLLNLTFIALWLLFFGYLFKQIDGAYVGVFRSAASYGRNIYIYMLVHYLILIIYTWAAYRFYRQYFLMPRNLGKKTLILLLSAVMCLIAWHLAYFDAEVVDQKPEWEVTSSFWYDYYISRRYGLPR